MTGCTLTQFATFLKTRAASRWSGARHWSKDYIQDMYAASRAAHYGPADVEKAIAYLCQHLETTNPITGPKIMWELRDYATRLPERPSIVEPPKRPSTDEEWAALMSAIRAKIGDWRKHRDSGDDTVHSEESNDG